MNNQFLKPAAFDPNPNPYPEPDDLPIGNDPSPGHVPDAGRALARQFHRDRRRFLDVLRNLDRDAWRVLAEAYCAFILRVGITLTPEHVLRVWTKAVDGDIQLPPNVHPIVQAADASAESYAGV